MNNHEPNRWRGFILGAVGYCLLILLAGLGGALGPRRRRFG